MNCTYSRVSAFVLGLLGLLSFSFAASGLTRKSSYTDTATATASNVVTTSRTVKGKTEYSTLVDITYEWNGKPKVQKIKSSNVFSEGETIPILYNPVNGEAVIKSEYISPSGLAHIFMVVTCICIFCCVLTFSISYTTWGCRFLAFSTAMQMMPRF